VGYYSQVLNSFQVKEPLEKPLNYFPTLKPRVVILAGPGGTNLPSVKGSRWNQVKGVPGGPWFGNGPLGLINLGGYWPGIHWANQFNLINEGALVNSGNSKRAYLTGILGKPNFPKLGHFGLLFIGTLG